MLARAFFYFPWHADDADDDSVSERKRPLGYGDGKGGSISGMADSALPRKSSS
jgi:hypothetical protein